MQKLGKRKFLSSLTAVLALSLAMPPAQAQNPYWYLYMGQSLLYPITRGLWLPYMYGPYNSNPFYSMSSILRRNAGMAAQYPYVYGYNQYANTGYRNLGMPAGQSVTGVIDPATGRTNPNYGNGGNADSLNAASQSATAGSLGGTNSGAPDPENFYLPGTKTQSLYADPNLGASGGTGASGNAAQGAPPLAPQRNALPAEQGARIGTPIADGFVNHLVTKYDGNIQKALSNGDTRNWAKAMGVIEQESHDGSTLSPDRVEVIGRILRDNSLDSGSKLDAVRILLKQKAPGQ